MNRNKNILSVFLIIVLAFALCSCKNNANITEHKNNTTVSSVQTTQKEKDDADNHIEPSETPASDVEVKNEPLADNTKIENKSPKTTPVGEESPDGQSQIQDESEISQNVQQEQKNVLTCSLIVHCDDVIKNIDLLDENKKSVIPSGGVILTLAEAEFKDGESVFDVVYRELKNANIHFEFEKNPMYNSAYIKGIGNLYEFDCGDCSGWLYKVNGTKPNVGCSQYTLRNNDKIELYYSCNYLQKE